MREADSGVIQLQVKDVWATQSGRGKMGLPESVEGRQPCLDFVCVCRLGLSELQETGIAKGLKEKPVSWEPSRPCTD